MQFIFQLFGEIIIKSKYKYMKQQNVLNENCAVSTCFWRIKVVWFNCQISYSLQNRSDPSRVIHIFVINFRFSQISRKGMKIPCHNQQQSDVTKNFVGYFSSPPPFLNSRKWPQSCQIWHFRDFSPKQITAQFCSLQTIERSRNFLCQQNVYVIHHSLYPVVFLYVSYLIKI